MKYSRAITIISVLIAVLAIAGCLAGFFTGGGSGQYEFTSIRGETVNIYGSGLYRYDSVSVVAQGQAQDLITIVLAVPLLLISLFYAVRGSFRGRLMLTGTLGYFLYSYMSYTFLWMYNPLFLLYTALMSLSLYAFILCFMTYDIGNIPSKFGKGLPVKFLGGFQIFIGITLSLMWLGRLAPSIFRAAIPAGLEHYTTFVIQGMDLGFIVPTAFLSGILFIKRKPMGYLLSSVVITKAFTMTTCMTAMVINQLIHNVKLSIVEVIIFVLFNLVGIACLFLLMKHVKKA